MDKDLLPFEHGQSQATDLGYVALPASLVRQVEVSWTKVSRG